MGGNVSEVLRTAESIRNAAARNGRNKIYNNAGVGQDRVQETGTWILTPHCPAMDHSASLQTRSTDAHSKIGG